MCKCNVCKPTDGYTTDHDIRDAVNGIFDKYPNITIYESDLVRDACDELDLLAKDYAFVKARTAKYIRDSWLLKVSIITDCSGRKQSVVNRRKDRRANV